MVFMCYHDGERRWELRPPIRWLSLPPTTNSKQQAKIPISAEPAQLEVDFALLNQMLVNFFTVLSRSQPPAHDTPFVKAKGGDNRLDRTTRAKQSNNEGHPGLRGLQPVKRRSLGLGKSLSTPDA